jgi:DNA-binding transcriptional regulator YdaS (Cro superfamily)
MKQFEDEPGLRLAVDKVGSKRRLARLLGLTQQTVYGWTRLPVKHLDVIERQLGIPRERLRPDLYEGFVRADRRRQRLGGQDE